MGSTWNITIDDTSPMFNYMPYSDGSSSGWTTWYSGSGFNAQGGEAGQGVSWHLTNGYGSSVSLAFYGTGFQLLGNSSALYDAVVDEGIPDAGLGSASNVLYSRTGLPAGNHTVELISRSTANNTMLFLDKAIVFNSDNANLQSLPVITVDNMNLDVVTYTGAWTSANNTQIPSTSNPSPFHFTDTADDSVTFNFTGGSAFAVYGSTNWGHGLYQVNISSKYSTILNGSTYWLVPNALVYYQDGLDASQRQIVTFTNLEKHRLAINYIDIYGTNVIVGKTGVSQKSEAGVIAGSVVGAVVFLVLLSVVIYFIRRRRRKGLLEAGMGRISPLPVFGAKSFTLTDDDIAGSGSVADTSRDSSVPADLIPHRSVRFDESGRRDGTIAPKKRGSTVYSRRRPPPTQEDIQQDPQSPPPTDGSGTNPSPPQSAANSAPVQSVVDIDRILEMVYQRIDPPQDPNAPLPPYRG